jgi:hypothetical protein
MMAEIREISIPVFRYLQVNTAEDGTIKTPEEVFKSNMIAAMEAWDSTHPDEDTIIIALKEKIEGDYRYSICCLGPKDKHGKQYKYVTATMWNFKNLPSVILGNANNFMETVTRIIKNLVFS